MTENFTAYTDEQGRLIVPPHIARALGLTPNTEVQIEKDDSGLRLRPSVTALRKVYIEITNLCNLNCSTCMRNVWDAEFGRMGEDTFERVLTGIQAFSPQPEIFFGGYGEPLSHPGCLTMLRRAKELGLRVSLITNGILLTEAVSRQLIDMGLDMLWVSLDGASPECYTDVRLGNALPTILDNLKTMRYLQYSQFGLSPWAMSPRLGIAFVAMQRNIRDLPELIRLGTQLGAVEYSISNVLAHDQSLQEEILYRRSLDQTAGRQDRQWKPLIHMPKMDISPATGTALVELLKGSHRLELAGSELEQNNNLCPFVERGSMSVRWDGRVSPCLPLLYTHTYYLDKRLRTSKAYSVGNILDNSLSQIWMDAKYLELRKLLREFDFSPCTVCNSCEMADHNLEDCYGNLYPTCGGCLWAQGLIRCP